MADETTTTTEGAPGAAASPESTTEPSSSVESDFLAKARANPAWAEEQVKSFQSAADKAISAEAKAREVLDAMGDKTRQYVEKYGGEAVAWNLDTYAALRNHPVHGSAIQEFERTGQLPTRFGSESNAAAEEEYLTPEEEKIKALETEMAQIKQSVKAQTSTSARTKLTEHMQKVVTEFGLTGEMKDKAFKTAEAQINAWEKAPGGEAALLELMKPGSGGYRAVKGIMLADIEPADLMRAQRDIDLRKRDGLSALATESPGGVASTGREKPAVFATAREAAKWAAENPDMNESR